MNFPVQLGRIHLAINSYTMLRAGFLLIGCVVTTLLIGCSPESGETRTLDLTTQAEEGVTLRGVRVKYNGESYSFGVVNKFGASVGPIPLELRRARDFEISWWETSENEPKTAVVTLEEPTEAELKTFQGVILFYSKASGWTGELSEK